MMNISKSKFRKDLIFIEKIGILIGFKSSIIFSRVFFSFALVQIHYSFIVIINRLIYQMLEILPIFKQVYQESDQKDLINDGKLTRKNEGGSTIIRQISVMFCFTQ